MNILITGGAGFVGTKLTCRLQEERHHVIILDKAGGGFYNDDEQWVNDILDLPAFNKGHEIDVVIHCAAIISEVECQEDISKAIDTNIKGTVNVLKNCVNVGVKKFIFLSSAAVYGECHGAANEFALLDSKTIYGMTKLMAEYFVNDFRVKYNLNTTVFRPFNLYGPGMKHKGKNLSVISAFIRKIIFDEDIMIFGDGKYVRDYVFIDDVIEAIIIAMDPENEHAKGGTFNISTGEPMDVLQLASMIGQKLHKTPKIKYLPKRYNEILYSVGDPRHAGSMLNFRSKIDIIEGIQKTVDWFSRLALISNKNE